MLGKAMLITGSAIGTAFASALCCAGPLLAVTAGVSGAGLASTFEPLRPYFLAATAVFLLLGFFLLDREEKKSCEPGKPCADASVRGRMKVMLWISTIIAIVFASYPRWQLWILS